MGEDFDEPTMDAALIASAQRVEHYEMAAYGTLVAWAEAMGHTEAAELLQATLDEEKAADEKLTELADGGMNREAAAARRTTRRRTRKRRRLRLRARGAGRGAADDCSSRGTGEDRTSGGRLVGRVAPHARRPSPGATGAIAGQDAGWQCRASICRTLSLKAATQASHRATRRGARGARRAADRRARRVKIAPQVVVGQLMQALGEELAAFFGDARMRVAAAAGGHRDASARRGTRPVSPLNTGFFDQFSRFIFAVTAFEVRPAPPNVAPTSTTAATACAQARAPARSKSISVGVAVARRADLAGAHVGSILRSTAPAAPACDRRAAAARRAGPAPHNASRCRVRSSPAGKRRRWPSSSSRHDQP